MTRLLSALTVFFLTPMAIGAPNFMVVEGQLLDSLGQTPVEEASVVFTLELYSPAPTTCLLYQEQHTLNMTGSQGLFSLELGRGSQSGSDYEDINTLATALDNHTGAITPTTCVSGPSYTPAIADSRFLRISYNAGNGLEVLSQDIEVGSSAYALSAGSLQGKSPVDFLQVNISGHVLNQTNLEWLFDSARYTELQNLINGTSSQYNQGVPVADVDNNSQKIINVANPTLGTDATNKNYVDQNIGGLAADSATLSALAPGNSGEVMTWNGTQWTSSTAPSDSTKLPLAGGTMTGALNMGTQNITNVNDLTVNNNITATGFVSAAGGLSANGSIALYNGANYMGFQSPGGAADLIWTLPAADGTSGQFLQTNGSGVLSWSNPGGGGETNTGSNVGAGGIGVFSAKSGVDLQFRNINAASGKISVVLDGANQEVDIDVVESALSSAVIPNTPAGGIAATDIQGAINELDTDKISKGGDSGAALIIGTNDVNPLQFETNNAVNLEISAGGDTSVHNKLGIGTQTPSSQIHGVADGSRFVGKLQSSSATANDGSEIIGFRTRGTAGAPAAINAGDNILTIGAAGRGATVDSGPRSKILVQATENWTDAAQGTDMAFYTTQNGTTAPSQRLLITDAGQVGINNGAPSVALDVTGDIAASGNVNGGEFHGQIVKLSASPGCVAGRVGELGFNAGQASVCLLTSAPSTYAWVPVGKANCPSGWQWAGPVGDPSSLCISPDQNVSFNGAANSCKSLDNRARHCSRQQLSFARAHTLGITGNTIVSDVLYSGEFQALTVDANALPNGVIVNANLGTSGTIRCCID